MEGNQGMCMEFHRRCMMWDENKQDKDMLKFMKQIIKIRKENKELNLLDNNWIRANRDENILIYSKKNIFIIMNNSDKEEKVFLPKEIKNNKVKDLFEEKIESLKEDVELKPFAFRVYKKL